MIEIAVIATCLVFNAFLAMCEMAFVTARKSRMEYLASRGNKSAKKLLSLRENPERTLSVIQIGITLVGAVAAAVGGAGAQEALSPWLRSNFGIGEGLAEAIAITTVVVPITYLSVVVGELVPKSIAIKNSEPISLTVVHILAILEKALSPVVSLLEISTKFFTKFFVDQKNPTHTESIQEAIELDSISPEAREAILRHSHLDSKSAKDVMTAWKRVVWIRQNMPVTEVSEALKRSGHTRIPVYDGEIVTGILHAKEFFAQVDSPDTIWQNLIRPSLNIQMGTPLTKVLSMLQRGKAHMAIVLQEHQVIGIVTIEDIIEEIFGEFYEDFDVNSVRGILSRQRR